MSPRRVAAVAGLLMAAMAVTVCMLVTPLPGHPAGWMLAAVVGFAAGLAGISTAVAWKAHRHHRLARQLSAMGRPSVMAGIEVQELAGSTGAFVAGLRQPRIFCSPALGITLSGDELRAVLLHERFHQLDQAPAKLVVLEALAPALNLVSAGRAWLARRVAALEIAADRYALDEGSSRGALARALVKLAPASTGTVGVGFASATELRIGALLGDEPDPPADSSLAWLVGPAIFAAVCVALVVPA